MIEAPAAYRVAVYLSGSLHVVEEDPEVFLDVGDGLHHAGSHSGLHLPV